MSIDYKKELETAAKNMILVHEPDMLIKMIVRMLVQKVNVKHAGLLLRDPEKDTYILSVSRGPTGLKIPAGFARTDTDNPLIRFFRERFDRKLFAKNALVIDDAKRALRKKLTPEVKQLLKGVLRQMEIFGAVACIPNYFRNELVGVILLGAKKDKKKITSHEMEFFIALASDVAMAIRNAQLFSELESELDKKHRLFIHTTVALAAAIDAKDHYTHGHTARVTNLSLLIANKLSEKNKKDFDSRFLENLHIASLLHDIGKIGISENILNKEGPLNAEERSKVNEHPLIGTAILQPIKELEDAILGVKYHHERADGSGYPEGLKGDQIPLSAAIISVADAFDAMTTNRPYRRAFSKEEAIKEIQSLSGKQFDSQMVSAFVELYKEGKI